MCVVSMIHDHYWPTTLPRYPRPEVAPTDYLKEYLELVRKAAEYDKIHKEPDCIKPEYENLRKIVEEILDEREKNRNK